MPSPDRTARKLPASPGRTRHALAAAQASEYAAELVSAEHDGSDEPGDLITTAGRLIVHALCVRDWAVTAERERGTSWQVIATAMRTPEPAVRATWELGVTGWLRGSPGAPQQPGAPGGLATIAGGAVHGLGDAATWLGQWLHRRAVAVSCPLPEPVEPAARRS